VALLYGVFRFGVIPQNSVNNAIQATMMAVREGFVERFFAASDPSYQLLVGQRGGASEIRVSIPHWLALCSHGTLYSRRHLGH